MMNPEKLHDLILETIPNAAVAKALTFVVSDIVLATSMDSDLRNKWTDYNMANVPDEDEGEVWYYSPDSVIAAAYMVQKYNSAFSDVPTSAIAARIVDLIKRGIKDNLDSTSTIGVTVTFLREVDGRNEVEITFSPDLYAKVALPHLDPYKTERLRV